MQYFSKQLTGTPVGTMLRAITDNPAWIGHYFQGWVAADGKIRVMCNAINANETKHIAPPYSGQ
jgi:hypothetical protein